MVMWKCQLARRGGEREEISHRNNLDIIEADNRA